MDIYAQSLLQGILHLTVHSFQHNRLITNILNNLRSARLHDPHSLDTLSLLQAKAYNPEKTGCSPP